MALNLTCPFSIIPSHILNDVRLDDSSIVLFCRLTSYMNNQHGACYASNSHLAKISNCKETSIKDRLNLLEKCGYIRKVTKKNGILWDRKIYPILDDPMKREKSDNEEIQNISTKDVQNNFTKGATDTKTSKNEGIQNNFTKGATAPIEGRHGDLYIYKKDIYKKEPTSLPPSSVVGSPAVVKAPAKKTLPPDPVAKKVATAPKPSQSSACSKNAPPAGDAKSVADAPSGELLFLLEKYKKENNDVDVDKNLFKQAYSEMKSRSDVKSPFGLLKFIFEELKQKSEASKVKNSLALKHRRLAEHCCGEGTGGSRFIEGNFYVKQSGSYITKHEFGVEDKIWSELEEIVKKKGIKAD